MKVSSKMLLLLVGFAALRTSESRAQGGWFQQFIEDESDIYAVAALDANTVVALDAQGRLLRISNGVLSVPQSIGADVPIYGLSFAGSTIGTAVGFEGTILRTTDGGVTWTRQSSGTTMDLIGVFLVDANVGTAVGTGGIILRTTDGGANWTLQDSGTTNWLFGVALQDANTGIAVGDGGTILSTTDGGETWLPQFSDTTRHLQTISFTNPTTAIAVGDFGTILRTTDGGRNWEAQRSDTTDHLYGLAMFDANRGMAVGCQTSIDGICVFRGFWLTEGTVHETFDGGVTWSARDGYFGESLFALSFFGDTGAAVGQRGNIQFTTDLGLTWRGMGWTGYGLQSVSMVDANTGTAVGRNVALMPVPVGVIIHTTNGGYPWRWQYSGTTNALYGVSFVDANTGTAVGARGTIVHTTDGGATWVPQNSGTTADLAAIFFLNADLGWVVGVHTILRTADGGRSWSSQTFPSDVFQAVHFADANNGVAGGTNFFRTTDGGNLWTRQQGLGLGTTVSGIHLTEAIGAAVVNRVSPPLRGGYVYRSTDGGATWGDQRLLTWYGSLRAITLVNRNIWFAVGSAQTAAAILRTTNGGIDWSPQPAGDGTFYGISFGDANTGTAVGVHWDGRLRWDGYSIWRTETGGE